MTNEEVNKMAEILETQLETDFSPLKYNIEKGNRDIRISPKNELAFHNIDRICAFIRFYNYSMYIIVEDNKPTAVIF